MSIHISESLLHGDNLMCYTVTNSVCVLSLRTKLNFVSEEMLALTNTRLLF